MERVISYVGGTILISIKKPGIYSMGFTSSVGKSNLYHILNGMSLEDIYVMTYDSDIDVVKLKISKFKDSSASILYVDRFDLLISEDIVKLLKDVKDKYIILDYKEDDYNPLLDASYLSFIKIGGDFRLYA